jgi:ABC-type phosphate transport system substrate-binding protein
MVVPRHRSLAAIVLGAALLSGAEHALAADIFVIANPALAISVDDVREIYLGEMQLSNGVKIVPLDNASLQKDFLEKVIRLDANKYGNVWIKKGFREGITPPAIKNSEAEVIGAVKATPGAVGYVSTLPAGVKLIQKY